jgi:hypothetical protein
MNFKKRWIGLLLACAPVACSGGGPDEAKSGAQALLGTGNSAFGLPVWRPSDGRWYEWNGYSGHTATPPWGMNGDIPVRMNVAGTPNLDEVVFRPKEGKWYVRYLDANFTYQQIVKHWGMVGDFPAPGDYDNDGLDDYAVFRPSNGMWYVSCGSSTAGFCNANGTLFGTVGDVPVPGDYDGDGKNDLAVFRPSEDRWYVLNSSTGQGFSTVFATARDAVAQADFDGDNRTDIAVFRASNSTWYIRPSNGAPAYTVVWGTAGDIVTPLDFDGDGKADVGVWRPSNGRWYFRQSSNGFAIDFGNGQDGDLPIGTTVTMAVVEPMPNPPPMPDPPPPIPPGPMPPPPPTKGNIAARLFLDTANTTFSCGMAPFWHSRNGGPNSPVRLSSGSFTDVGRKPGLKRCRFDADFFGVDAGGGYTVCSKAGVNFCKASQTVTAAQTLIVNLGN